MCSFMSDCIHVYMGLSGCLYLYIKMMQESYVFGAYICIYIYGTI